MIHFFFAWVLAAVFWALGTAISNTRWRTAVYFFMVLTLISAGVGLFFWQLVLALMALEAK